MDAVMLLLLFLFMSCAQSSDDQRECVYGLKSGCPADHDCVKIEQSGTSCLPRKVPVVPVVNLPFLPGQELECDQGALPPEPNSHTWSNTAFALDLKSNAGAKIVAVFDGEVIAHGGCTMANDQCGLGFGNHIKVLREDGVLAFYAHLKSVAVKSGQLVKAGDVLGSEGMTGWTGANNPHLHFSLHFDWRGAGKAYWQQVGFLPRSIPFEVRGCFTNCSETCAVETRNVTNLVCKRTHSKIEKWCVRN
jgi:hypothetical protein